MHGGQAIPAFDFYLAPFVRYSYIEEVKKLEDLSGEDLSALYDVEIEDYIKAPLEGMTGTERWKQHAVNRTVSRVHQSMEAFIHNMNTIHSRGGNQVVFSSINYGTDTSAEGRCIIRELLNSTYEGVGNGATAIFPFRSGKEKGSQLSARRPQPRPLSACLQGDSAPLLPELREPRRDIQPA